VAYTVPKKRKRDNDEDDEKPEGKYFWKIRSNQSGFEEEYDWIREYNYKIQPESDTYFFSLANGYVNYNPITHRVNLTKSKALVSEKTIIVVINFLEHSAAIKH
jgi:hypothetical protein